MVKTLAKKGSSKKKETAVPDVKTIELYAFIYFVISTMLCVALFSFSEQDTSFDSATSSVVITNLLGVAGAYLSSFLISSFGLAAWTFPLILCVVGGYIIRYKKHPSWTHFFIVLFGVCLCAVYSSAFTLQFANENAGGLLGKFLYSFLSRGLGTFGIVIISCAYFALFCRFLLHISILTLFTPFKKISAKVGNIDLKKNLLRNKYPETEDITLQDVMMENIGVKKGSVKEENPINVIKQLRKIFFSWYAKNKEEQDTQEAIFDDLSTLPSYDSLNTSFENKENINTNKAIFIQTYEDSPDLILPTRTASLSLKNKEKSLVIAPDTMGNTSLLPTTSLLDESENIPLTEEQKRKVEQTGALIIECLAEFKVQAELVGYTLGPVVTQYQIKPLPGVRVNKIKTFDNDIALKLKASSVRIQAPIPETDLIGIEVPNKKRTLIYFQELLVSSAFKNAKSPLTMALGKDTAGVPFVADLAKMPHLLIAGATGAGKSVALNSIILSFLYKASPKELQLLLIDPKRVELKVYQDLPHLVHPVVTDVELACNALSWAVYEMERRYTAMEKMGSREIGEYNTKVKTIVNAHPEQGEVLKEFPLLVIIVDELADLILTTPKEVETNLTRLSQLARAAGIHIILATQRPSVDVVTALIKANFPSRISFRVTSRHDSTTILGNVGAENLLGKGDMLFKTTHTQRLHGAYVSTAETEAVVEYWKSKEKAHYSVNFTDFAKAKSSNSKDSLFVDEDDPVYQEAVSFVYEQGKASISSIQRRFRIGFNKAARYVEQMESDGIITSADGSPRARTVRRPEREM